MECRIRSLIVILLLLGAGGPAVAQICDPAAVMQTTQPKPRPDFQADRQALFVRSLLSGSYGAIALGDSILAGWQPRRLQDLFGRPTLSIAFGGDGTEQILWRLRTLDWSRQNPQYVLLLVGTNDIRFPACAIAQGIVAAVRTVHTTFPQARVIVTSILPRGTDLLEFDAKIVETNRQLAAVAQQAGFRFLDVHDAFLCGHHTPCPLYLPGNLHLTEAGYQLLIDHLRHLLQSG